MNRRVAVLLAAFALIAAACSGGKAEEGKAGKSEPIIIGAAVALSGPVAAFDAAPLAGLKLAIQDTNSKGGVLGRPLELVVADTKGDPDIGANAALEVLDKGAQFVVVSVDFDWGSPAARIANDNGVVAFSLGAASPRFGPVGIGPFAFTNGTGTPTQAAIMAEWAYKEKGWRTAYILSDDSIEYTKTLTQYFTERWTQLAGQKGLLGVDTFLNPDPSIASQITRIESLPQKPDFIYLPSYPPGGVTAIRQIRAAGIDLPLVGSDAYGGSYWRAAVPDLSDVFFLAYGSITGDDPDSNVNRIVSEVFKVTEHPEELTSIMLAGYSVIEAYTAAVEMADSTDPTAVRDAFESFVDVPLVVGPTTFTKDLHLALNRSMRIIQIVNGKDQFVTIFRPEKVPLPAP
jgi:branched-chain amino acid transport system substrate-binding protein